LEANIGCADKATAWPLGRRMTRPEKPRIGARVGRRRQAAGQDIAQDIAQDMAQDVAVAAFAFLAADAGRLGRFLDVSGIPVQDLRAAAKETDFLAGVLDHVGEDEPLLLAFAAHAGIAPDEIMRARTVLAGRWERDLP
jgi:hypothetical protein